MNTKTENKFILKENIGNDIGIITGFLNPKGKIVLVPLNKHYKFIKELGISRNDYQGCYGAIRLRAYKNKLNIEIRKQPTKKQMEALHKIKCEINFDLFGQLKSNNNKDSVSLRKFMESIKEYKKLLKENNKIWTTCKNKTT